MEASCQSSVPSTSDYMTASVPAEYCSACSFPFKEMGACPKPDVSVLWAYLSLVPYLIPLVVFLVLVLTRQIRHFKTFSLLATVYVLGDKVLKNIIRSPRPPFSCKRSFGMPSSHMAVMVAFSYLQISKQSTLLQQIFWVALTVLEGYSRIALNYHTFWQVVWGTLYALAYSMVFEAIWSRVVGPWLERSYLAWARNQEMIPDNDTE